MDTSTLIAGFFLVASVLVCLACVVMSIVDAFKRKEVAWGILNLLVIPIAGIVWFFLKRRFKLAGLTILSLLGILASAYALVNAAN